MNKRILPGMALCLFTSKLVCAAPLPARSEELPLAFEPNVGQTDPSVRFLSRTRGGTVFFTDTEVVLLLQRGRGPKGTPRQPRELEQAVVRMILAGARPPRAAGGLDRLAGVTNYYLGNDPAQWHAGVPQYARLQYSEIYPGVDMVCYGNHRNLEYDFVVAPKADPRSVQLIWEGVDQVSLNDQGDLLLKTSLGEIVQKRPHVYQDTPAGRVEIAARYSVTAGGRVSFALARYDRRLPLVIDPQLVYSTYLGGEGGDMAYAVATDSTGAAYVTGSTNSNTFPLVSPVKTTHSSLDIFVTKFDPSGASLIYSTFLGGGGNESGFAICVDSTGAAYITGDTTSSTNFPTLSAYQGTLGGGFWDAFVIKLTPAGGLGYGTYLGGNGVDEGHGIAVDSAGNAYVAGYTASTDFPRQSPIQNTNKGGYDSFISKLSPDGSTLVYSTYLGGSQDDQVRALAVDSAGAAYVTGTTSSPDLPTVSAYQPTSKSADVFVAKVAPGGGSLAYCTYLGGGSSENVYGIAVDSSGSAYVAGSTLSQDFPIVGGVQPHLASNNYDIFVTKFNPSGTGLVYSTYFGGSGTEVAYALAIDSAGAAYVTGWTNSTDFPAINQFQTDQGGDDGFIFKLTPDGSAVVYSTYLGGNGNDYAQGIALDPTGAAYVVGYTDSVDFITLSPFQGNQAGTDAFVSKIEPFLLPASKAQLISPHPGSTLTGNSVTFTWTSATGATAYGLGVGTGQGNDNIYQQELGLATSQTVTNIPTNGSPIWVRLVTQNGAVGWNDYEFKAFLNGAKSVMTAPAPGSVLNGPNVTFKWLIGTGSSSTQLDIGTAVGLGDIFSTNEGVATSQAITGLPTDGSTIYVRLTTNVGTFQFFNDYTYQTATGPIVHACDVSRDGLLTVADAQQLISEILGLVSTIHDLNADGAIDVVDTQIVINAIMGRGCAAI